MYKLVNTAMLHLFMTLSVLGGGARRRTATARGANFIEYALLAVIAVIIFVAFRGVLTGAFDGVFERVSGALGWEG